MNKLFSTINIRQLFVIFITTIVVFVSSFAEDFDNEDGMNISTTSTTSSTTTTTNDNNNNDPTNDNSYSEYAVRAYECDSANNELVGADRVQKIIGSTIQICFVPTEETIKAGVGIKQVTTFHWTTHSGLNDRLAHTNDKLSVEAVMDGKTDCMLNTITCTNTNASSGSGNSNNDNTNALTNGSDNSYNLCVLHSMLVSSFYLDTGSVIGEGTITLTNNEIVPVHRGIFHQADVNFGETSGQCITDTNTLLQSSYALNHATQKYQAMELQATSGGFESMQITSSMGASGSVEEVIIGTIVSITVPEGSGEKEEYAQTCIDAGGVLTELPDTIVDCLFYGQAQQMEMINSISCLADTEECNTLDVNQILLDAYELAGIVCRNPTVDDDDDTNNNSTTKVEEDDEDETLIPTTAPSLSPTPLATSSPTPLTSSSPTTTLEAIIALSPTDTPTATKNPIAPLVPFSENTTVKSSSNSSISNGSDSSSIGMIVGIVFAILVVIGIGIGIWMFHKNKKASTFPQPTSSKNDEGVRNHNQFRDEEIDQFCDEECEVDNIAFENVIIEVPSSDDEHHQIPSNQDRDEEVAHDRDEEVDNIDSENVFIEAPSSGDEKNQIPSNNEDRNEEVDNIDFENMVVEDPSYGDEKNQIPSNDAELV